jgi:hypothetical protein
MDWLGTVSIVGYAAAILGCLVVVFLLVTGRWEAGSAIPAGWALCPASLVGGLFLASAATPDWNPYTMFALFVPFFAISAWALYYSLYLKRGADRAKAGVRALFWAVPSLLLAPVVMLLLIVL